MIAVFVCVLILLCLAAMGAIFRPASTAPMRDGRKRPCVQGIASLEHVTLGGVRQSILVRGVDAHLPVLLFLHGGPGTSEMGLLRVHAIPALEKHFIVVVWDQRGAGRSFAAHVPEDAMTLPQFVEDTCELAELLRRRFGKERIYLAGHSWGSVLGVLAAQRRPDLFHAYVGIGQVANMREGERISHAWTLQQTQRAGDARAVATLRRIGTPPYSGDVRAKVVAQRRILAACGGEVHGNPRGGLPVTLRCLLRTTEYSWRDRINFFRGIFLSMRLLWPALMEIDLTRQVPALEVPVYFLLGRHDFEAPSALAAEYYHALRAPWKRLVWFEHAAHFIHTEEPEAFNSFFIHTLLRECPEGRDGTRRPIPARTPSHTDERKVTS